MTTVVRPAQQKFICLLKDRNGTFKMRKTCKDKDLIWHMVSEVVKIYRVGRGCLFHVIILVHSTF